MAYQIITDGSCDLGAEAAQQAGVRVVPFYVTFDGKTYLNPHSRVFLLQQFRRCFGRIVGAAEFGGNAQADNVFALFCKRPERLHIILHRSRQNYFYSWKL